MHHSKCKVRSGSPVADRVTSQCPPPRAPPGGCPPAALKRCCQYEHEPPPALTCKPLLPAFYETDKQRPGRRDDKSCPCCLQPLPPPKPDACGVPCPPAPKPAPKGHDCCTKNTQHQLMGGAASPNARCCHHHGQGAPAPIDECGHKSPLPASKCCPMPEHHQVCPPFGTNLPCAHEIEIQCTDSCAPPPPPCWQPSSAAHGKQSARCPTPCLDPRLPPCPPECSPGAECLPDQRGALRPDARDCPALGRNFCVHQAAPPACPGSQPHADSKGSGCM